MRAGLVASTVTPGITEPVLSVMRPEIALCADAARGARAKASTTPTRNRDDQVIVRTPLLSAARRVEIGVGWNFRKTGQTEIRAVCPVFRKFHPTPIFYCVDVRTGP